MTINTFLHTAEITRHRKACGIIPQSGTGKNLVNHKGRDAYKLVLLPSNAQS